jgi:hypothetical protein
MSIFLKTMLIFFTEYLQPHYEKNNPRIDSYSLL